MKVLVTNRDFRTDAALRPQPRRGGPDDWPTPSCLLDALVTQILPGLPPGPVWEPAPGSGALVAALRGAGRDVLAPIGDFLADAPPVPHLAAIMTNPPFNALDAFVARGLAHLDAGSTASLTLLWRWDHLTAGSRGVALRRAATVHLCQWRPRWIVPSTTGPRWSFAWITRRAGHTGPPMLLPVPKPDHRDHGAEFAGTARPRNAT